jgi:hypothetical protein
LIDRLAGLSEIGTNFVLFGIHSSIHPLAERTSKIGPSAHPVRCARNGPSVFRCQAAAPPEPSKATNKKKASKKPKTAPAAKIAPVSDMSAGVTDKSLSGKFYNVCAEFFEADWPLDEIEAEFVADPEHYDHTSRDRYEHGGRLRDQIEACYAYWCREREQNKRHVVTIKKAAVGDLCSVEEARQQIDSAVAAFLASADEDQALKATTGSKKTQITVEQTSEWLHQDAGRTVLYVVPRHDLGDEVMARLPS